MLTRLGLNEQCLIKILLIVPLTVRLETDTLKFEIIDFNIEPASQLPNLKAIYNNILHIQIFVNIFVCYLNDDDDDDDDIHLYFHLPPAK